LSCEKCFAFSGGDVRLHSLKLKEKLGHFGPFAKRFETLLDDPVYSKYPAFAAMLEHFATESCHGCRNEICKLFKTCGVRPCHEARNVDFCFQCDEFPCDKTGFDENLRVRWVAMNRRMQEVGVEEFYAETRDHPRYPDPGTS
jgi:hypothetical protein